MNYKEVKINDNFCKIVQLSRHIFDTIRQVHCTQRNWNLFRINLNIIKYKINMLQYLIISYTLI
jgi:hypothetical protein